MRESEKELSDSCFHQAVVTGYCISVNIFLPLIVSVAIYEVNKIEGTPILKLATLLIAEILSGKNARAWVSMDFT